MAGRKRIRPRDERLGVTPLRGKPPPPPPEPGGRAADPGPPPLTGVVWPQPEPPPPGYGRGTHGTTDSPGRPNIALDARARAIETAILEDPEMADHLRSPMFRKGMRAMCRAEARDEIVWEWLCAVVDEGGVGALMMPPMPGTRAPIETSMSAEARAAWHRARMGLDPVSYAKIARDLGIAGRAAEDGLVRLAGQGAEIIARREALAAASSWDDDPDDPDDARG